MKIVVGSKNPVKVAAVEEIVQALFPRFRTGKVISRDVPSGVSEQPKSLDETIRGATNRARSAAAIVPAPADGIVSFGIESGIFPVAATLSENTGISHCFDVCVCVIHRPGKIDIIGMSSIWELPRPVRAFVREHEGKTIDDAFFELGYTTKRRVGYTDEGAVGILSGGRLTRKDYTKQAILAAFTSMDPKERELSDDQVLP